MMVNLLAIISIVIVLAVVGFIIAWHRLSQEDEEPMDYTIVRMYFPEVCKYAEGLLLDFQNGSQRKGLTILPKDVDYMRKSKDKNDKKEVFKVKPIKVWANDYQIRFYPRGTLSPDRNIIDVYPPIPEGLPSFMRDTPQGSAIMEYVAKKKAEKTSIDVMRMERDTEDELLKDIKGKNLFTGYLEKDKALSKDLIKKYVESEQKSSKGVNLGGN